MAINKSLLHKVSLRKRSDAQRQIELNNANLPAFAGPIENGKRTVSTLGNNSAENLRNLTNASVKIGQPIQKLGNWIDSKVRDLFEQKKKRRRKGIYKPVAAILLERDFQEETQEQEYVLSLDGVAPGYFLTASSINQQLKDFNLWFTGQSGFLYERRLNLGSQFAEINGEATGTTLNPFNFVREDTAFGSSPFSSFELPAPGYSIAKESDSVKLQWDETFIAEQSSQTTYKSTYISALPKSNIRHRLPITVRITFDCKGSIPVNEAFYADFDLVFWLVDNQAATGGSTSEIYLDALDQTSPVPNGFSGVLFYWIFEFEASWTGVTPQGASNFTFSVPVSLQGFPDGNDRSSTFFFNQVTRPDGGVSQQRVGSEDFAYQEYPPNYDADFNTGTTFPLPKADNIVCELTTYIYPITGAGFVSFENFQLSIELGDVTVYNYSLTYSQNPIYTDQQTGKTTANYTPPRDRIGFYRTSNITKEDGENSFDLSSASANERASTFFRQTSDRQWAFYDEGGIERDVDAEYLPELFDGDWRGRYIWNDPPEIETAPSSVCVENYRNNPGANIYNNKLYLIDLEAEYEQTGIPVKEWILMNSAKLPCEVYSLQESGNQCNRTYLKTIYIDVPSMASRLDYSGLPAPSLDSNGRLVNGDYKIGIAQIAAREELK